MQMVKTSLKLVSCAVFLTACFLISNCAAIKPYEKEYLLHPLMDDASVARLEGSYVSKTKPLERLAAAGAGSGSTSCPTCGGK